MYELCALLAPKKKPRKARVQAHKSCRVGAQVQRGERVGVIVERDTRYASAWFVEFDGVRAPHSFSRDMLKVL